MPASIRPTSRCVSILAALRSAFLVLTWAPALRCFAGTTNGFRGTSISFRFSFRFTFISFQSIVYGAVGTVTIRPSPHLQCGANPSQLQRQKWWRWSDSNRQHPACKAGALPIGATPPETFLCCIFRRGGNDGKLWSGQRDSNSRHRTWKDRALPTELCPQKKLGGTPTENRTPFHRMKTCCPSQ